VPRTPHVSREVSAALTLVAGLVATPPASAQLDLTGYALAMASASGSSAFVEDGTTLLGRARLMTTPSRGALTLDLAYEHVITRSSTGASLGLVLPGVGGGQEWLDADWRIRSTGKSEWRHRLDRLSVSYASTDLELTVGRQAISWATTLFLTPADPFVPFDPSDPFRVYRAGVDAARLRIFPGPFTELEAVVRPRDVVTTTGAETRVTALARLQTSTGGWAWGAWAGVVDEEGAGAAFATGAIGSTAIRGELSVRDDGSSGATLRGTLGLDRYFTPGGKDLFAIVELQYDGFGTRDVATLFTTPVPATPVDRQVLGRWAFATQLSYQIHPLVGIDALALLNPDDGSVLVAPGVGWSATAAASIRLGLFSGLGRETVPAPSPTSPLPFLPGSEYGAVPAIGYLSLTWYF